MIFNSIKDGVKVQLAVLKVRRAHKLRVAIYRCKFSHLLI